MSLLSFIFLLWLAIVFLPFAMRSWRSFFALCAIYLLFGLSVRLGIEIFSADDVPSFLVFMGNFWIDLVIWLLPITFVARAVCLAAKSWGLRGLGLMALNGVAVLALPGFLAGQVAYDKWKRRPPPAECVARPLPVTLGGLAGFLPYNSEISLYLGSDLRREGRYLGSAWDQRSLCRDTSNGSLPRPVAAIVVRTERLDMRRCEAPNLQPWEQNLCAMDDYEERRARLPSEITIFQPDGIRLGDFGIPAAATDGAIPLEPNETVISSTDDAGGFVSAVCRPASPTTPDRLYCRMRRNLTKGIDIYWETSGPRDTIRDQNLRVDAFATSVCADIFHLPGCAVQGGDAAGGPAIQP